MKVFFKSLPLALYLIFFLINAMLVAYAYVDGNNEDVVLDAPWRTERDYVPFLFFIPERSGLASIESIGISMWDAEQKRSYHTVLTDDNSSSSDGGRCSTLDGERPSFVEYIDPEGFRRGPLEGENLDHFWHVVLRVPVECLANGAGGLVKAVLVARTGQDTLRTFSRVMWIKVDRDPLPKFRPSDHYYDSHVHTIAEQTTRGAFGGVDSARKAFGGPLVMLVESAYALGLVDKQMNNGNWSDFANEIAITDHNVFFSASPYDSGDPPKAGPTSDTDGHLGEFRWYRSNLGVMAGEEVTMSGHGRKTETPGNAEGRHVLSYGGPHLEGPWHGGNVEKGQWGLEDTGTDNYNTPENVLVQSGSSQDGFLYLAHPLSKSHGTPVDLMRSMLGYESSSYPIDIYKTINQSESEFTLKGVQMWNEKNDWVARRHLENNQKLKRQTEEYIDPWSKDGSEQQFLYDESWDRGLLEGLREYSDLVREGLDFELPTTQNNPSRPLRIIRKLYLSGGSDAHGDFNSATHSDATILHELDSSIATIGFDDRLLESKSNAFGRVLTYTLSDHVYNALQDRDKPHLAYNNGNTIITDGPICKLQIDTNCSHDSDVYRGMFESVVGVNKYCENKDGLIGGGGLFDGGNTALYKEGLGARGGSVVNALFTWDGKNQYGAANQPTAGSIQKVTLRTISTDGDRVFVANTGAYPSLKIAGQNTLIKLPQSKNENMLPRAVYAHAEFGSHEGRDKSHCITNPVWLTPYNIIVQEPETVSCPIAPGNLVATVGFGLDVEVGSEMNVSVVPLDENGEDRLAVPTQLRFVTTEAGRYVYSNIETPIQCGTEASTNPFTGNTTTGEFALIVQSINDPLGNRMNSIMQKFEFADGRVFLPETIETIGGGAVAEAPLSEATGCSISSARGLIGFYLLMIGFLGVNRAIKHRAV